MTNRMTERITGIFVTKEESTQRKETYGMENPSA